MSSHYNSDNANNQNIERLPLLQVPDLKYDIQIKNLGNLSEAEIQFLAQSKQKKYSAKIINNIIKEKLTLYNYKEILCLSKYTVVGGTINPDQVVRNIRYKDENGNIVATVQIDTINKKIRMQNLGDFLPKQECFTPQQIGTKVRNLAKYRNWSIENGCSNQW